MSSYASNPTEPRQRMVDCQLRPSSITNPKILNAFLHVDRETFLPRRLKALAYCDQPLALENGIYEPPPLAIATLIQHADIQPTDSVLVAGVTSGYTAAIVSYLANSVVAVVLPQAPATAIQEKLAQLDLPITPAVAEAELTDGYPKGAPFDVILVMAAVTEPLLRLEQQLEPDNGRLLFVYRQKPEAPGQLRKLRREDQIFTLTPCCMLDSMVSTTTAQEDSFVF